MHKAMLCLCCGYVIKKRILNKFFDQSEDFLFLEFFFNIFNLLV